MAVWKGNPEAGHLVSSATMGTCTCTTPLTTLVLQILPQWLPQGASEAIQAKHDSRAIHHDQGLDTFEKKTVDLQSQWL